MSENHARELPEPGQVAWLKVVAVNNTGVFLAWGRPKDLLLPFSEQAGRAVVGQHCLVCILLDEDDRPFASGQLDEWIHDIVPASVTYAAGDRVALTVADTTDLGVKVIVDDRYWGLLYRDEIFRPVHKGQQLGGYVKKLRDDGKLDVTINPPTHIAAASLAERILAAVDANGGQLMLTDKSRPEAIQSAFGVSKSVFKQALGALYKQRLILIETHCIRRAAPGNSKSSSKG